MANLCSNKARPMCQMLSFIFTISIIIVAFPILASSQTQPSSRPRECDSVEVLPATEMWLPDIAMMNAEGRYTLMGLSGEKVRVYSDGYSIYSPGGTFSVFCEYNLTLFPFDEQICAIKFESWRYTHTFMTFNLGGPEIKRYQWFENEQWTLVGTSQKLFGVSYFDPENSFDRVEFVLTIQRKSRYYLVSMIIPSVLIMVAQVSIFALPVCDVCTRSCILFSSLLTYIVFMMMIHYDLPRSSDNVPVFSTYIDVTMAAITITILEEAIVFYMIRRSETRHPDGPGFAPQWLARFTIRLAHFLRMQCYYPQEKKNENKKRKNAVSTIDQLSSYVRCGGNSAKQENGEPSYSSDLEPKSTLSGDIETARLQWYFIADVTDRFIMWTYFIGIIVVPVVLFIVFPAAAARPPAS